MDAYMGIDGFWEIKENYYGPALGMVHSDKAENAEDAIAQFEAENETGETTKHEILALDVLGNETDGWEINGQKLTGIFVEIPNGCFDTYALYLIRKSLDHDTKTLRDYEDSCQDENAYCFDLCENGKPAYYTRTV